MKTISRYIMTLALLLTAVTGAWAEEATKYTVTFKANGNTKTVENVTLPHTFTSVNNQGNGELDLIINDLYNQSEGWCVETPTVSGNSNVTAGLDGSYNQYITISAPFEGNAIVSGSHFYDNPISSFTYTLEISVESPSVDVTLNDTKTEASFLMPTSDVTVNYELVRDMTVDVTAEVGDGSDGYRIRIKKDGDGFVPVDENALDITVTDILDAKNPAVMNGETDYTMLVQKQGDSEDQWTDVSNDAKLSEGTYRYKVTGTGNNTGVIYSNAFVLFTGYEVTIPAGEYITYYKDEALMVEDEDAQLYTITAVGSDKATATELKVAPAETPLLVKNNAKETKTIVLIPTKETADNVKAADGFKGTLTGCTIAASTDAVSRYAFNGLQFVWVKNAIEIGANKCWLEIGAEKTTARSLDIDFGDGTTGISTVLSESTSEDWYDLNGRKYATKPTRKGVYINNGRKVVIK